MTHRIETHEVLACQQQWKEAVLRMTARAPAVVFSEEQPHLWPKDFLEECAQLLRQLYDFEHGDILFKPTLGSQKRTFRRDLSSALSYFVNHREDAGFALKGWKDITFENTGILTFDHHALAMGHYHFHNAEEEITSVEYSFVYHRYELSSPLKIILHHSSLPYNPPGPAS